MNLLKALEAPVKVELPCGVNDMRQAAPKLISDE